jgi:TonB family protein
MNFPISQDGPFALLPKARTPWTEFAFSTTVQVLMIALLAWVRLLHPEVVSPLHYNFSSIRIVDTPAPVNHQPQVRLPAHAVFAEIDPPANALRMPAPLPKVAPRAEEMKAPTVQLAAKLESLPVNAAPVIPKQGVKMNTFATGSSAAQTIDRAASQVQTGGFGDPNGIPAKASQGKVVNIASVGSFDLPTGPGSGNGTGGAKGVAGVVASTGFGNGIAVGESHPRATGTVQSSGFASVDVATPSAAKSHHAEVAVNVMPAEILSKPTPVYTQEARSLRIEGEVLLQVVLEASGNLRVLHVVHGLGHGLDDNAVKAAEQIRFKPATKDGQPTDSTVVLHVVFQLA